MSVGTGEGRGSRVHGTSWTEEENGGESVGRGCGWQTSAPTELLRQYGLGRGQGLLQGCSEPARTGP